MREWKPNTLFASKNTVTVFTGKTLVDCERLTAHFVRAGAAGHGYSLPRFVVGGECIRWFALKNTATFFTEKTSVGSEERNACSIWHAAAYEGTKAQYLGKGDGWEPGPIVTNAAAYEGTKAQYLICFEEYSHGLYRKDVGGQWRGRRNRRNCYEFRNEIVY
jgi:hypothetical protein